MCYICIATYIHSLDPLCRVYCFVQCHPDQDGAEPSPNSVAASNLQRLSAYLGRPVDPSPEAIYKTFNEMMSQHPVAIPELLAAFIHHSRTTKQVNRNKLFMTLCSVVYVVGGVCSVAMYLIGRNSSAIVVSSKCVQDNIMCGLMIVRPG